jgi:hypothetical protein
MIDVHPPVPEAHAVQRPVHVALPQQKPSLQRPDAHSTFDAHAPPAVVSGTHDPLALQ